MYREFISDYQMSLCINITNATNNLFKVETIIILSEKEDIKNQRLKELLHELHMDMQENLYDALDDIVTA